MKFIKIFITANLVIFLIGLIITLFDKSTNIFTVLFLILTTSLTIFCIWYKKTNIDISKKAQYETNDQNMLIEQQCIDESDIQKTKYKVNKIDIWNVWNSFHDKNGQERRLMSAKEAERTPLSIDKEQGIATFSGKSGIHNTSLKECSCPDFRDRQKPCKHMYRLAIELGLIQEKVETDINKIEKPLPADSYALHDLIKIINDLPDDTQKEFKEFLYYNLYQDKTNFGISNNINNRKLIEQEILDEVTDYRALLSMLKRDELNTILIKNGFTGFKKNLSLEKLIEWCCEHAPNLNIQEYITVTLNIKTKKSRYKIYSYLKDKYDEEKYYS